MPGKVIEIIDAERRIGRVEVFGIPRLINLGVLDAVGPGDWVLVQVGFAVERIDEEAARETMQFLEELGQQFERDLATASGEGGDS